MVDQPSDFEDSPFDDFDETEAIGEPATDEEMPLDFEDSTPDVDEMEGIAEAAPEELTSGEDSGASQPSATGRPTAPGERTGRGRYGRDGKDDNLFRYNVYDVMLGISAMAIFICLVLLYAELWRYAFDVVP